MSGVTNNSIDNNLNDDDYIPKLSFGKFKNRDISDIKNNEIISYVETFYFNNKKLFDRYANTNDYKIMNSYILPKYKFLKNYK